MKNFLSLLLISISFFGYCGKDNLSINITDPFLEIYLEKVIVYNEANVEIGSSNTYGNVVLSKQEKGAKIRFTKENYRDTIIQLKETKGSFGLEMVLDEKYKAEILKNDKSNFSDEYSSISDFPDSAAYFISKNNVDLMRYISKTVNYPQYAIEYDIQGKVYLAFIIEIDGTVSHVSVMKGVSRSIDQEALRVVSEMPKWEPALDNGIPVRSLYRLPIIFKLQ